MKKMTRFIALLSVAATMAFASCGNDPIPPEPEPIKVASVSLNETTKNMVVGDEFQLVATVLPTDAADKSVNWSAVNNEGGAVSVDGTGKVTALAVGTATVTVTTVSGGLEAKCDITVTANVVPVESVSVAPPTKDLTIGEVFKLEATVLPATATDMSVTWSSDNETVATVDIDGNVTAIALGTAKITATTVDGPFEASCDVTVKAIEATGITIDPKSKEMVVGDEFQLTATVAPSTATDKSVTWSSDNETVVTVDDNGKTTALAVGTAKVTATTADGKFSDACDVTVKAVHVTEIVMSHTALVAAPGFTTTLTATAMPEKAENKAVEWSTSDSAVATVDENGVVTIASGATEKATATITATAVDKGENGDQTITAKCDITVSSLAFAMSSSAAEVKFSFGDSYGTTIGATGTSVTVDWGDGNMESFTAPAGAIPTGPMATHTYAAAGNHDIKISVPEEMIYLDVAGNGITSFATANYNDYDTKYNRKIKYLNCSNNELTALYVFGLRNIQELNVSANKFATFSTTNVSILKLNCANNQLATLDVSKLVFLQSLHCENNVIGGTINFSANTSLTELYCANNQMTGLSVGATKLNMPVLDCSNNLLESVNIGNNAQINIITLNCSNNKLSLAANLSLNGSNETVDLKNNLYEADQLEVIFDEVLADRAAVVSRSYQIIITDNPGAATCDITRATAKHWTVVR